MRTCPYPVFLERTCSYELPDPCRCRAKDAVWDHAHPHDRRTDSRPLCRTGDAVSHPFQHRAGSHSGWSLRPFEAGGVDHLGAPQPCTLSSQGRRSQGHAGGAVRQGDRLRRREGGLHAFDRPLRRIFRRCAGRRQHHSNRSGNRIQLGSARESMSHRHLFRGCCNRDRGLSRELEYCRDSQAPCGDGLREQSVLGADAFERAKA